MGHGTDLESCVSLAGARTPGENESGRDIGVMGACPRVRSFCIQRHHASTLRPTSRHALSTSKTWETKAQNITFGVRIRSR